MINADRFSAYRLGGALPFTSDTRSCLPGYFYEELSAQDFGLLYGFYAIPLGPSKSWSIFAGAATSVVHYLDGLEESGSLELGRHGWPQSSSRKIAGYRRCSLPATASMRSAVTDEAGIVWPSCCSTTSAS